MATLAITCPGIPGGGAAIAAKWIAEYSLRSPANKTRQGGRCAVANLASVVRNRELIPTWFATCRRPASPDTLRLQPRGDRTFTGSTTWLRVLRHWLFDTLLRPGTRGRRGRLTAR